MDYRGEIIEMLEKIQDEERLEKILAVVKTHYELEKEKGED